MLNHPYTTVAYLGPAGTHSHNAALSIFGESSKFGFTYLPRKPLGDVFKAVHLGHARFGVIPLINNVSGQVEMTFDILLRNVNLFNGLAIVGSFQIHISHDLLGTGDISAIKCVYSKEDAFKQCRINLKRLLPPEHIQKPVDSTTDGASLAVEEGPCSAVLASRRICDFYPNTQNRKGLKVLKQDIQDKEVNETRFIVIVKSDEIPPGKGQHSWFMFKSDPSTANLSKVLGAVHQWGVLPVSLQSTLLDPFSDSLAYLLEVDGHRLDHKIAFFETQAAVANIKYLGTSFQMLEPFSKWVVSKVTTSDKLGLLTMLAPIVQDRIRSIMESDLTSVDLFLHEPVTSVESVWSVLGTPANDILRTIVLLRKDNHALLVCCLLGNQSVDISKVSQITGAPCVLCPRKILEENGLVLGAISPLTFSEQTLILIDKAVGQRDRVFAGTGRPDMSVRIKTSLLLCQKSVQSGEIAYADPKQ
jgi:chorismate mutase/prephenate dehydratase